MFNDYAIILCAGRGNRLRPVTDDIPKCLVKIKGIPIIDYLRHAIRYDLHIYNIYVVVGYKGEMVAKHLREHKYTFEHLKIIYQKELNGTANAIYLTKKYINNPNRIVVLSGDTIYRIMDLKKLLHKHDNTVLYTFYKGPKKLSEYGTLNFDEHGYITKIDEKNKKHTSYRINCGAYKFNGTDVFDYIEKTPIDTRFNEKIITDTINLMIKDGIKFKGALTFDFNEITYVDDIKRVEGAVYEKEDSYYRDKWIHR